MTTFTSHLIHGSGTVALDCDGVLLDFLAKFQEIGTYALGRPLKEVENAYDLSKRYGLTDLEHKHVHKVFVQENGWSSLPPLPGAIDAARELQDAGHRVIVVTAIDEVFKTRRMDNFKKYGFVPDAIYCVGAGSGHTKGEAYTAEQPHAIVDDRLVYLKEAQTLIKSHQPELVWINDTIPQHGHLPDFVHHEIEALHHWANPITKKVNISIKPQR